MTSSKSGRYKITAQLTAGKAPKTGEPPHAEFANMGDDAAAGWAFYDRWGSMFAESLATPEQGERARASGLPCPYLIPELREEIRKAWRGDEQALAYIQGSAGQHMKFSWEFNGKEIDLVPEDLWSTIALLFLRDKAANRLGICENTEGCHSPYFVKRRSTQKLCEAGACTQWAQRQYALRHWNAHGKQQRQEQQQKKSKGKARAK